MRQENETTGKGGENFASESTAILKLRKAVANGSWSATEKLADVYLNGAAVVEKNGEIWRRFEEASESGNPVAERALGDFSRKAGNVVDAIDFYERALDNCRFALVEENEEAREEDDRFDLFVFERDLRQTIGELYANGEGDLPRDLEKALELWRDGADCGCAESAARAADVYLNGPNEVADFSKALEYLERALELGDAEAGWTLWRLSQEGRNVGRGLLGALQILERAADLGSSEAAFELYRRYRDNEKKRKRALAYLKRAAELGSSEAAIELYFFYSDKSDRKNALAALEEATALGADGNDFEFYLENRDEIDDERALAYLKRAEELGSGEAAYELYRIYQNGLAVRRDVERALSYLERAAELACSGAFYEVYRLWRDEMKNDEDFETRRLDDGEFEESDERDEWGEEADYYRRASELDKLEAAFFLYRHYRDKRDASTAAKELKTALGASAEKALEELYRVDGEIELSDERESACLEQAAKLGSHKAAFELYRLYYEGDKVERNVERALVFLERATALNSREAFFELYRLCRDGDEACRIDPKDAAKRLERSAELGFDKAIFEICRLLRRRTRTRRDE